MARMIDADALQELCNKRIKDTWNSKTAPVSWAEAYADFKDDVNSIPAFAQPGNPLTLDQLREMDGQPVWVEFIGHPDGTPIEPLWMLVNCREKRLVTDVEYVGWNFEGWFAYSYPPAHIDRSKWISVKERLPDFGIPVLICWDGYTDIAEYWCGMVCPKWRTQHYGTVNLTSVTHWMPLPEPPEEG